LEVEVSVLESRKVWEYFGDLLRSVKAGEVYMMNVTTLTHTGKELSHYKREGIRAGNGGVENEQL
jgi:hypothetical protein